MRTVDKRKKRVTAAGAPEILSRSGWWRFSSVVEDRRLLSTHAFRVHLLNSKILSRNRSGHVIAHQFCSMLYLYESWRRQPFLIYFLPRLRRCTVFRPQPFDRSQAHNSPRNMFSTIATSPINYTNESVFLCSLHSLYFWNSVLCSSTRQRTCSLAAS